LKKLLLPAVALAALAMLGLVALSLQWRDRGAAEGPAPTTAAAGVAGSAWAGANAQQPVLVPVAENQGRIQIVPPPRLAPLPPTVVEPLFAPDARVKIGETAKLRFAAHDRASGLPESLDHLSATVSHGKDPELKLPVEEVENGVYQVPFNPHGPGQFTIVLSQDGIPVSSRKVGVAGVAGTAGGDAVDPLDEDPRVYRARTSGKGRWR